MEGSKKSPLIVGGIIVLVLAVAAYGAFKYTKSNSSATGSPADTTGSTVDTGTTPPASTPTDVTTSYSYKDGTYSAVGNYNSPGGQERIDVRVTLKNDVIADAVVEANHPSGGTAVRFQGIFTANFKQYVVGKKIDDVQLTRVSGSSLTPGGFNDALAKIKAQAQV